MTRLRYPVSGLVDGSGQSIVNDLEQRGILSSSLLSGYASEIRQRRHSESKHIIKNFKYEFRSPYFPLKMNKQTLVDTRVQATHRLVEKFTQSKSNSKSNAVQISDGKMHSCWFTKVFHLRVRCSEHADTVHQTTVDYRSRIGSLTNRHFHPALAIIYAVQQEMEDRMRFEHSQRHSSTTCVSYSRSCDFPF